MNINISPEEVQATARAEFFSKLSSRDEAKELFRHAVDQVEIEVFSYCNRTCSFCPNSIIDRRSVNNYMPESLYLRVLNELAEIDYAGAVTYSRYNEPLADRIILSRIRQARAALPNAHLMTFTNGDYLTRDLLDELRDAGLNQLIIMTYLAEKANYSDVKVLTAMTRKIADLGLLCEFTEASAGLCYEADLRYKDMAVSIMARNFAVVGADRGAQVATEKYERFGWCPIVFKHLYIDWNGSVVPCCNIRSDAPAHKDYIVDDLSSGRSIFEAYASSALVEWRRGLFSYGPKPAPCNSCSHAVPPDTPEMRALVDDIAQTYIA
jgi:hypothetical protein